MKVPGCNRHCCADEIGPFRAVLILVALIALSIWASLRVSHHTEGAVRALPPDTSTDSSRAPALGISKGASR